MESKIKISCVTGHRYIVENSVNIQAVNKLIDIGIENGIEQFYVGMSRGADFLFAQILSERKLSWHAIIPCVTQTHLWSKNDQLIHKNLIDKADDMIILHEDYKQGVMHYRNKYMVDKSELVLAIYDNSNKGGTAHTVNYAIKNHKSIYQFNPNSHEYSVIESRQLTLF